MYIGNYISTLDGFDKHQPNFMIVREESFSYQGSWYGPPDPQPGTETKVFLEVIGFKTKEDVAKWIKQETEFNSRTKKFKVFAIDAMAVKTDITVSFES
jgi:hypothetical protein